MSVSQRHLVLVGLMATGKTTVGRLLAQRLNRTLLDSDTEIERSEGRTVREIWLADGEPKFRRLEKAALARAVDQPDPVVIAAAGGVVLDSENRALLAQSNSFVVWLDAAPSTLAERAVRDDHRPLLDVDPLATIEAMARDRAGYYTEVADIRIDVGDLDPAEVVDRIEAALDEVRT